MHQSEATGAVAEAGATHERLNAAWRSFTTACYTSCLRLIARGRCYMLHTNAEMYLWVFFKKDVAWQKKKKKPMTRTSCCHHPSLSFGLQLEWADLSVPQRCPRAMSEYVPTLLHTPSTVFYVLAQFMHVIDCSHWPETSTRLTSAGNYWPPLIISQHCWGVYVCICTSVCHIFTINWLLPPVFGCPSYCPKGKITSNLLTLVVHTRYITNWRCYWTAYHWL